MLNEKYFIIDSIAPFCLQRCFVNGKVINWSKIPFSLLERNNVIPAAWSDQIIRRFTSYASQVARIGYNALSIDDLAHLTISEKYSYSLQEKIHCYQKLYCTLFQIAETHSLKIFVNTDAAFSQGGSSLSYHAVIDNIVTLCDNLLRQFPNISGLVLRLGECDGIDVKDEICSKLAIRNPSQAYEFIKELLNVFKEYNRLLIVRTWTVGSYALGDLMWNPRTYDKVFERNTCENLIVSHKYGESDFFKYLALNPLIFHGDQMKIVEFQARREYEGFGEFPSFIGLDYEKYRDQILQYGKFAGIHVWCQTGGWSHFHRTTFMPGSSIWNEINTFVTIKLFRDGQTARDAVLEFAKSKYPEHDPNLLVKLLELSDVVIRELWYTPEFSQKVLFFRRIRIPPIVWIFWDTVIVNSLVRSILQNYVVHKKRSIDIGNNCLQNILLMKNYAEKMGISSNDFDFQYATFELLMKIRQVLLSKDSMHLKNELTQNIKEYLIKYPHGFKFSIDLLRMHKNDNFMRILFRIILRNHAHYRFMEQIVFEIGLKIIRPLFRVWGKRKFPKIASERAMGIEALLK